MNGKLAVLLFFVAYLAYEGQAGGPCPAYQCSPTNLNRNANVTGLFRNCALEMMATSKSQRYVYLQTCMPYTYNCLHEYTVFANGTSYTCQPPNPPASEPQLPGWKCSTGADCMSNNCKNNFCIGLSAGQSCSDNTQCGLGLYCNKSSCAEVLKEGATCSYNAGAAPCEFSSVCVNNMCIRKMSFTTEAEVSGPNDWQACQSLTAESGKCVDPYRLMSSQAQLVIQEPCYYSNHGDNSSQLPATSAICGYSFQGVAVCAAGLGDNFGALQYIANNYFALKPTCHIEEADITACSYAVQHSRLNINQQFKVSTAFLQNSEASAFVEPLKAVPITALTYDNSGCTKELITFQWWNLFL